MKLYALVTIGERQELDFFGEPYMSTRQRCVGIYTQTGEAQHDILGNVFDLYEVGYYPFAVIEPLESDVVYGMCEDEREPLWFEWVGDVETGAYKPCKCPDKYSHIVGWWG